MKQRSALLLLLIAITTMPGCGIGTNSLLFVTKSNVGLDFDAKPPTAEVAISRVEGVVEPVFKNGETLPVMASFRTEGSGLFAGEIGQTFTTGDAALVMAFLYGDGDHEFEPLKGNWEKKVGVPFDSSLDVTLESPEKESFNEKSVRPVFFGTSTSFGAKLSWSGMTAAYPDSLHVGYRRKEFALAPISYSEDGGKGKVSVPSLLATIDIEGEAKSVQKSKLKWLQYFATGKAATALALRQNVRRAMIKRLDPTVEFGASFDGLNAQFAKVVLGQIESALVQLSTTDSIAKDHVNALEAIARAELPISNYSDFSWPTTNAIVEGTSPVASINMNGIINYGSNISASAGELSMALAQLDAGNSVNWIDPTGTTQSVQPGDANHRRLRTYRDEYVAVGDRIDTIIQSDPHVVAAVQYYFKQLVK